MVKRVSWSPALQDELTELLSPTTTENEQTAAAKSSDAFYVDVRSAMRLVERSKYVLGRMPQWRHQCMNEKNNIVFRKV